MKRIVAILLAVMMTLLTACSNTASVEVNKKPNQNVSKEETEQYVIALNPSIMFEDGQVVSLRNTVASSIQKDYGNNTTSLYEASNWKWITRNNDENDWYIRQTTSLSTWFDAFCNTAATAPYSYIFGNNNTNSLGVYDVNKMDVNSPNGANFNESGVIFSFTGNSEEGLCYVAENDCFIEFADRNNGTISVIENIAGMNASYLNNTLTKKNILLRIYKNNRIYWQEVINADSLSVNFPNFTNLELKAGDSVMITAKAIDSVEGITTGNCDIEQKFETVIIKHPHTETVQVEFQEGNPNEIPIIKDSMSNFKFVYPAKMDEDSKINLNNLVKYMEDNLAIYPEVISDEEAELKDDQNYILVGETKFEQSKKAISDIKKARTANAGDFIIRQKDNTVVIAALNNYSVKYALNYFKENYCHDKKAVIKKGLEYVSSKHNTIKNIMLGGVSITDYVIVLSKYSSFMETSAADYLVENIVKLTGKIIEIKTDDSKKSKNEILIGHTNRTTTKYSVLADNKQGEEFEIKVSNGKTSVLSRSNSAVNAGVIEFVKKLTKGNVKNGTYKGEYDGSYSLTNGYKLAWSEDFYGDKLSKTWKKKGAGGYETTRGGTTYSDMANASVKDGAYVAKVELKGNDSYGVDITANGSKPMYFKYGYVEGRVKMSEIEGYLSGLWVVTYTGGSSGTGEFDIYENAGKTNNFKPNLHIWGDEHKELLQNEQNRIEGKAPSVTIDERFGDNYHCFGMEWTDDAISFYIDGRRYYTFDCTTSDAYDAFDQYATVVYGAFSDRGYTNLPVPEDHKTSYNYVDWIRVWQKDEEGYGIKIK